MKRSTFIKLMNATLQGTPTCIPGEELSSQVLDVVEILGMLPPIPDDFGVTGVVLEDLTWEPEDEA